MNQLPPGQQALSSFPRFGLPEYATRVVSPDQELAIELTGAVANEATITTESLAHLDRVEQFSDFHCVTTWSALDLAWSGYRFTDLYEEVIRPLCQPDEQTQYVRFHCLDGYKTDLWLDDLLSDDVLLADAVNGESLGAAHGAPMRLVMPKHYGYKNPKHLKRMEFWIEKPTPYSRLSSRIDHPRARVEFEERGMLAPGWILRYVYRVAIKSTIQWFDKALWDKQIQ